MALGRAALLTYYWCSVQLQYMDEALGYNMGLTHIMFNKSNKTLWYVTLSVAWFNTIRDFD